MSGPATLTMGSGEPSLDPSIGCERLGRREREVLALVARGFLNRPIAEALGLSEATVKVMLQKIVVKHGRQPGPSRHILGLWYLAWCSAEERAAILASALPAPDPALKTRISP